MHSIVDKHIEIPKSVLQGEKMLKLLYPALYKKIAGYRNCKHLDELNFEKLKIICERHGWWEHMKFYVLPFLNLQKPIPVKEKKIRVETPSHDTNRFRRYRRGRS